MLPGSFPIAIAAPSKQEFQFAATVRVRKAGCYCNNSGEGECQALWLPGDITDKWGLGRSQSWCVALFFNLSRSQSPIEKGFDRISIRVPVNKHKREDEERGFIIDVAHDTLLDSFKKILIRNIINYPKEYIVAYMGEHTLSTLFQSLIRSPKRIIFFPFLLIKNVRN